MSGQRKQDQFERRDPHSRLGDAGAEGPGGQPVRPGEDGGNLRRERLDTIEWADDRTAALDPNRGDVDEDPMDDLMDGRHSDAEYRSEANRVIPTLGPEDERER
ncbi:hypothetical protein [Fulvimonas yonginensis]|uniref:Uncharacterized protein n=1 Tax=Fulvimonas yonginensis TaxID=1495200 RepID=A0ABU8JAJ3_9GAMM